MKKLIKSRRGVAIELAIGVMFVLMAFTVMLISTAGLQNKHRNEDYKEYMEMMEVNNVGEYVVANKGLYDSGLKKIEIDIESENTYSATVVDNEYKIYRGESLNDKSKLELVLTITLDSNGKITSWK